MRYVIRRQTLIEEGRSELSREQCRSKVKLVEAVNYKFVNGRKIYPSSPEPPDSCSLANLAGMVGVIEKGGRGVEVRGASRTPPGGNGFNGRRKIAGGGNWCVFYQISKANWAGEGSQA
ncbi:hypothetical protein Pmani_036401 [Petrolisthes manimaculis]|uniref:Uncharacterized protein n=1 Tax=Petrolisthes manimaculis TaxID=1843537 RepID=A0AAE1TMQ5_9EUCA|nr:hypothetical protein Pmani_036401 [Petrolisthes manimaculis]